MSDHSHSADDGAVHAHISSIPFYLGIFGALITLTLLTVGIASIHLGALNLAVAVVIASLKATLVVMFFMHLRYDNRFNSLILICSVLFIGVFFAYTLNDTDERGGVDSAQGTTELSRTGEKAPGGMKEQPAAAGEAEHGAADEGHGAAHEAPAPAHH